MTMTIRQIREKYPQYNDLSDTQLADKIHQKFYPDLPQEQVHQKLGLGLKSEVPETPFNPMKSSLTQAPTAEQMSMASEDEDLYPGEEPGVFGAYHDIQDMLGNALDRGGDFLDQVPENLSRIKEDISKNGIRGVGHVLGQLHAGNANLAKALVNTPHDFLKYMLRKNLAVDIPIPGTKWHTSDLVPHIPEDTGVEKALGLEADPERGDELTRAIPAIAGGIQGAKSLFSAGRKFLKAPDLKQAIRDTQAKVNAADSRTGKVFDRIESEVGKRGIGKVTLDPEVIEKAEGLLTGSKANKALIAKAKTGDYVALRKLQSDLRVKAEKALSSDLKAENDIGELMDETRQDINQGIAKHLKNTGHEDLANALKQARNEYRDIKQTYFSSPALSKVFGESQVVPKNPMTLLTEESTQMKKFMAKHPEVEAKLKKALSHKQKMKILGKVAQYAVGGATAGGTYKALSK